MLWVKAFHIIFMVTWFAAVFYLPRLFVYHTTVHDSVSYERFCTMEHKLFWIIMTPGAILTVVFGLWLMHFNLSYYLKAPWMHGKLTLILLLIVFHCLCGKWLYDFKRGRNTRGQKFFRVINEVPTICLIGIIILAVVKPF